MCAAAITGAYRYTRPELLGGLLRHPELEVTELGPDSRAGEPASALDVRLNGSLPAFLLEEVVR
jgi:N-acetyl-gamma-glutamylphosphate reductase